MSRDRDYYYEQVLSAFVSAFVKKDQGTPDLDKVIRKHKDRLEQLTKEELARRKREQECPHKGEDGCLKVPCDCNSRESVNSPVEPMSLETFRKNYFKDIQDMKEFSDERLYWLSKENTSDLEKDKLEYSLGNKKSAITTSIYIMTQIITDRVMKEMMGLSPE